MTPTRIALVTVLLAVCQPAAHAFTPLPTRVAAVTARRTPAVRVASSPLRSTVKDEVVEETITNTTEMVLLDVDVSEFDEWLIKMGVKEDPRIPEECRVDTMTKIKSAGKAGIVSYALTELSFWVISVPLAVVSVAATTGELPDLSTPEGKAKVGVYSVGFLTIARAVVPVRIALALALTPWVDDNIMSKFGGNDSSDAEECEVDP